MDRQQIDTLVKEMNVDTATRPVDQRVQRISRAFSGRFISSH